MNEWESLIKHPEHYVSINNIRILVKDNVFTPNPEITNSSQIILNNFPNVTGKKILDVGCGTGVVGIYSALNGAKSVTLSDIDDVALNNTNQNIKELKLEDRVSVKKSNLFRNISGKFDYIFANLPILDEVWNSSTNSTENIVKNFIDDCNNYIEKNGKVYFTWASFSEVKSIRDYFPKLNLDVKEIKENKLGFEWYLFELSF
jgi:16S rRNA G1207 methylase RsmC